MYTCRQDIVRSVLHKSAYCPCRREAVRSRIFAKFLWIDLKKRAPLLANTTGGMSGPGIFPLAVRMVYQVYEAVSIPIVGMGGVAAAEDAIELMLAGAAAVGVGAANLAEPFACKTIIEALPAAMERYGIQNLTEIIGGAHHG